ncbi:MAG: hypothetical protein DMG05_25200, partial [Acidobacteria bacterium]
PVSPASKPSGWQALPSIFHLPKIHWVAAGVVACLFVWIGTAQYRKYQDVKAEGEKAKNQVLLALHIASTKLNLVQKVVLEKDSRAPLSQPKESQ